MTIYRVTFTAAGKHGSLHVGAYTANDAEHILRLLFPQAVVLSVTLAAP